ncbi:hypothetical protein QCO44_12290, partial [Selenomonas sputigena]
NSLVKMIRSSFNNDLDDKQLVITHLKVLAASIVSIIVGILFREFIYKWISLDSSNLHGVSRWLLAIFVCAIITIILAIIYISILLLLRTSELAGLINPILRRIGVKLPFLLNLENINKSKLNNKQTNHSENNKNAHTRIIRSKINQHSER